MYKKIITSLLATVLAFTLVACGNSKGNTNNKGESGEKSPGKTEISNNNDSSTKTPAVFEKTFEFYGYSVAYANNCVSSERTGGMTVSRGADFWIVYSTPALFGEEFTVNGLDGITDKCANAVKQSVQTLQQYFDGSSYTEISVKQESKKNVAGNEALRVEGFFTNTTNNKTVEYIGYYLTTNVGGAEYPVFIIGLPIDADIDVLAEYLDESVEHISK